MNQNLNQIVKFKAENQFDNKKQTVKLDTDLIVEVKGVAFNVYQVIDKQEYYRFVVLIRMGGKQISFYRLSEESTVSSADYSEVIHPDNRFGKFPTDVFGGVTKNLSATYLIPAELVKLNHYDLKTDFTIVDKSFILTFKHYFKLNFSVNTSLKTEVKDKTIDVANVFTEFNIESKADSVWHSSSIFPIVGMKINNAVKNWNDRLDFALSLNWDYYEIPDDRKKFSNERIPEEIISLFKQIKIEFNLDDSSEIKYFKNNYIVQNLTSSKNSSKFAAEITTANKTIFDSDTRKVE
ncbi:hypothetical protein SCLARK_00425 [Spiroplasma clarkii]|uniref:Uncharacterized protein n=1 Tax=Spiroplasma clarkii TaxID=2139 RepID=A0A1Y0KZI1_9MOLU|nr:hypothetical protein [Spiroplasma clarkii]ARU91147.1 hypothetical protein SCLARK_00425 [Spiroplasma clarkii]ATX70589.1 hypothetical protein SCLAR_v1c02590 [Spiroplasma clarkii]